MSSELLTERAPAAPVDPADPYARPAQTFPRLTDEQVERATDFGVVQALPKGTVLFDRGDRTVDFFIVLEGTIEIYEPSPTGPIVLTTLSENQFTGELDLFNDRENLVGGRMGTTGRVIRTRRAQFRRLLAAEPDVAETIMRAFILRRVGIVEHDQAASILIGRARPEIRCASTASSSATAIRFACSMRRSSRTRATCSPHTVSAPTICPSSSRPTHRR
jgi:thioredoxin reductase (NADPH)